MTPLPRGYRTSREEVEQDAEERSSKRLRWWEEFVDSSTDCTSDSDTDSTYCDSPVKHAGADVEVVEESPLPGPSRKRSRGHNTVEDERSDEKSRRCYEVANNKI